MQWKSLLLFVAIADSGLARLHGHERRHKHHPAHLELAGPKVGLDVRDVNVGVVADLDVMTVVDLEIITVTTTLTGEGGAPIPTSAGTTTVTAAPAEITAADTRKDVVDLDLNASLGVSVDVSSLLPSAESTAAATATAAGGSASWTSIPSSGEFSTTGFGKRTSSSGSGIEYRGNIGSPWGSNILEVSPSNAYQYKYVVQFSGSNTEDWTVVIWNKVGPDGKLDGWYGNSALKFTLGAGETKYVAFDENSQGAWGAAKGSSLPTDDYGGYSCTWGEFDFGNTSNKGWSGWDVSAIQAQAAGQTVQGMKICNHDGEACSTITSGAATVTNAYTKSEATVDGIGGALESGAVRLITVVDYSG
ncbi:putative allergen Asp F4-like [Aspergillus alliaceus]|uniref:putative allergen Asp F4-like n=1 Tax=Petromyces alliaceus TaxID=209559 RepID=UPI0012A64429|nr:uncharacterized protein BDW43DRAFT_319080 [Aspergillus alliaceus]KAB8234002.1 hypothetical protein BDW43DRAFT_319080 [Aspergillus alliaceus]